jgi:hypothetical protein
MDGFSSMANVYLQTYICSGSKPILIYKDKVAGTANSHGKGKAWLFGTFIGHNGTAYRNMSTTHFVKKLLKECNVFPEHDGELRIRKRIADGKEAYPFLIAIPCNTFTSFGVSYYGFISLLKAAKKIHKIRFPPIF